MLVACQHGRRWPRLPAGGLAVASSAGLRLARPGFVLLDLLATPPTCRRTSWRRLSYPPASYRWLLWRARVCGFFVRLGRVRGKVVEPAVSGTRPRRRIDHRHGLTATGYPQLLDRPESYAVAGGWRACGLTAVGIGAVVAGDDTPGASS